MNILMMNVCLTDDFGGPSIAYAFCDLCRENAVSVKFGWLTGKTSENDKEVAKENGIEIIETGFCFSTKNLPKIYSEIKKIKQTSTSYSFILQRRSANRLFLPSSIKLPVCLIFLISE